MLLALALLTSCGKTGSSSSSGADSTPAGAPESIAAQESSAAQTEQADSQTSSTEEYPSEYSLEINDPNAPQITGAKLEVKDPDGLSKLENVLGIDVISSGTVGLVGCPVRVTLCGSSAVLTLTVDKTALGDLPFENLIVLKSGKDGAFDSMKFTAGENTVSFEITASDTYMLVDSYQWQSAWSGDVTGEAHETEFTVGDEFNFRVTLPEGVAPNNVSAFWEKTLSGEGYMMTKELMLQNRQDETDIRAELRACRYPGEDDGAGNATPYESFDERTQSLSTLQSEYLTVESSETWDLGGGRRGFVAVFHFPEDGTIQEQTNISAQYEYSDDTYISYSLVVYGHDKDTIDRCIRSTKSFVYTDQ